MEKIYFDSMPDFLITPASEKEKHWAAVLMAESDPWIFLGVGLDSCLNACLKAENHLYIARLNHEPVGVIILQDHGIAGSPYIKSIAVDSKRRNEGIGKQLLNFAEDKYRKDNKFIFLCVSSFNTRAQEFYKRNGYFQVGELKDFIVEGHAELLMQKRLK